MSWRNILDVLVVAMAIYYIIKLVRQTRANSVLKGLAVILLLTWISDILELSATNWILRQLINTGVIVLVVLFQPELRRGLEQIGRSNISGGVFNGERKPMSSEHDIQEMIHALTNLSRRKVGALIVIENKTGLNDIIASGTMVDAEISSGLIENIFEPNTPLHDGAVVVRNGRITAAACFLPLSENSSISRELGTRHRAALGISETTDATVLIVSEETGTISMAQEGRLTRYLDAKALSGILTALLASDENSRHLFSRPAKPEKESERP
ncbi:MAG: diadenylate cyclase CdaA [Clostridia bacterium]|nr:diadenylate cyclase CdaA [Clostridia bacterium]MBR4442838.1 diadenylate cyclase CdaA [Clostridia bacterium]